MSEQKKKENDILKSLIPIKDYAQMASPEEIPVEQKEERKAAEKHPILIETDDGQLAILDEDTSIKPVDKISNTIVNQKIVDQGEQSIDQFVDSASGEKVATIIDLSYQGEKADTNIDNLNVTIYMREVLDALTSLFLNGHTFVTPSQVYRKMIGSPKHVRLNNLTKDQIVTTIDNMRFLNLKINSRSEKPFYDALSATYESYLVNASKATIVMNGVEVSGYKLHSLPIISQYALAKGQVVYVNNEILKIPNVRNTELFISTRAYLLRRVEQIRSILKRHNHVTRSQQTILYKTIYEVVGDGGGNRQKNKRVRTHVKSILDYWKRIQYIQDYEIVKKNNRTFHSIICTVGKTYQLKSLPEGSSELEES